MKVYVDFDNTIVESHQKVIELLNAKYNTNKSEDDLEDYNYVSIAPITNQEKNDIFECDDFFSNLKFKQGFLEVLNKYHNDVKFIVTARGTEQNLEKTETWVREHIPYGVEFMGSDESNQNKKDINMENAIQINDCFDALNTNAGVKILYKDNHNFQWQNGYSNTDVLVVNTWKEIDEILSFYSLYDYKTLDSIK